MHKRSLKHDLQRRKRSLKIARLYEDEVIKLKTLKIRRMVRDSFISGICEILELSLKVVDIAFLRECTIINSLSIFYTKCEWFSLLLQLQIFLCGEISAGVLGVATALWILFEVLE
ncbi:hypothetical protein M9H77_34563 [Catharanthus roseus]|uniref:Uncharacterized protein n=1 Tax=Catharanthus roseus TaxID=4058 RepID=A0ACB9ZLU0_CATRO|nr:hypothetical protein M9H77_34563 [Catharanthus roseus]